MGTADSFIDTETLYLETTQGAIAYRKVGNGPVLILLNRFRGTLDTWDPLFIDELARGFSVILFDYPGVGLSQGKFPQDASLLIKATEDFIDNLKINRFALAGWAFGGSFAQLFTMANPDRVSKLVLLGCNPIGRNASAPEQIYFDTVLSPYAGYDENKLIFFDPASARSMDAAHASYLRSRQRTRDLDLPVSPEAFGPFFRVWADITTHLDNTRSKFEDLAIPVLVLMGDRDPGFPVENWLPLLKKANTMHLFIISQSGHAPHHQYPEMLAAYICSFLGADLEY